MQILGLINNVQGVFRGPGAAPPAGAKTAIVTAQMDATELADASDYLRLSIYADFGAGPKLMVPSPEWHGGTGATAPTVTWSLPNGPPPLLVYGEIENGTRGDPSKAKINSVTLAFT